MLFLLSNLVYKSFGLESFFETVNVFLHYWASCDHIHQLFCFVFPLGEFCLVLSFSLVQKDNEVTTEAHLLVPTCYRSAFGKGEAQNVVCLLAVMPLKYVVWVPNTWALLGSVHALGMWPPGWRALWGCSGQCAHVFLISSRPFWPVS